jgi:hypothetical protein
VRRGGGGNALARKIGSFDDHFSLLVARFINLLFVILLTEIGMWNIGNWGR